MSGPVDQPAKAASGSSFYAGMRILPREKRQAMYDVYAFCRAVDDIADGDAHQDDPAGAMQRWRADIDAIYVGRPAGEAAHLAPHVARYGLKRDDFLAVIDGMDMDDVGIRKLSDFPKNARRYIDTLGELIGFPVEIVSIGPDRAQTVMCR